MGKKRWEQKTLKSSIFKRKGGKGERAVAPPPPPPCKKANKGKKVEGGEEKGGRPLRKFSCGWLRRKAEEERKEERSRKFASERSRDRFPPLFKSLLAAEKWREGEGERQALEEFLELFVCSSEEGRRGIRFVRSFSLPPSKMPHQAICHYYLRL